MPSSTRCASAPWSRSRSPATGRRWPAWRPHWPPISAPRLAPWCREIDPGDVFAQLAPVPPATGVLALARRPAVDARAPPRLDPPSAARPAAAAERSRQHRRRRAGRGRRRCRGRADHRPPRPVAPDRPARRGRPAFRPAGGPHRRPAGDVAPAAWRCIPTGDAAGRSGAARRRACWRSAPSGTGLDADLLARATHRIAIPMRPGVSSLNLATAVAVTLYAGGPHAAAVTAKPHRSAPAVVHLRYCAATRTRALCAGSQIVSASRSGRRAP